MFSNTTMASSTTRPIARTNASKVSVLIVKPRMNISAKAPISETGMVTSGINVAHYEQILASGVCDVCKEHSGRLELLLHEATRGGCWTTKDEQKALRKKAISAGY